MSYRYEFLSPESMDELFDTFLEAFADYAIDISQYRRETFVNRSIKNGPRSASTTGSAWSATR